MRFVGVASWVFAALILVALPGAAWAKSGCFEHGGERFIEKHAERLGLDEATRDAIREIVRSSSEEARSLREEYRAERGALHDLLHQHPPDRDAVMAQAEKIGAIKTELRKHRLDTMLRIHALLTPEQLEELVEIRDEYRSRRFAHLFEACGEELGELCAGVEDPRSAKDCLRDHVDALGDTCREAVEHKHRHKCSGRRWGRGWDEGDK